MNNQMVRTYDDCIKLINKLGLSYRWELANKHLAAKFVDFDDSVIFIVKDGVDLTMQHNMGALHQWLLGYASAGGVAV